jgi:hypothetical protein
MRVTPVGVAVPTAVCAYGRLRQRQRRVSLVSFPWSGNPTGKRRSRRFTSDRRLGGAQASRQQERGNNCVATNQNSESCRIDCGD